MYIVISWLVQNRWHLLNIYLSNHKDSWGLKPLVSLFFFLSSMGNLYSFVSHLPDSIIIPYYNDVSSAQLTSIRQGCYIKAFSIKSFLSLLRLSLFFSLFRPPGLWSRWQVWTSSHSLSISFYLKAIASFSSFALSK